MNLFKRLNRYLDGIGHDIRLFNPKAALITCVITLILGMITWFIGGSCNTVTLLYVFPRWAISTGIMYVLWAVSFLFIGIILGGIMFGCEKFKRREAIKATIFLFLSFIFTLCVYPTFFKALAPFITFILLLLSALFCLFALMIVKRIFALWTIMLGLYIFWLVFNGYLSLVFALIN